MNLIRCIINANQSNDVQYGIATTPALIDEYNYWLQFGGQISIYRKDISEINILESFNFNINKYAEFLFSGNGECEPLSSFFEVIRSEFNPDVVISFTQNCLIEAMSREVLTLFCERGPLPRWNGRDNFYFDPVGHQRTSVLSSSISEIKTFDVAETDALAAMEEFRVRYEAMPARLNAGNAIRAWIEKNRNGRSVAMIANQPHGSLLVRGATKGAELDTYMMRSLAKLPADWMAFGTYHADMGDCSKLDERLSCEFPNYIGLPPELRQFGSDPFSDEIDGVITIGSKAALVAALLGKQVIANPETMLAGLARSDVASIAEASKLSPLEAGRLLAFLASRFTIPNEYLLERSGYWLERVRLMQDPNYVSAFATDATLWDSRWVGRMYGLTL